MKDYVKKNNTPVMRYQSDERPGNDRWLIGFIIATLALAGISAAYTLHQKQAASKESQTLSLKTTHATNELKNNPKNPSASKKPITLTERLHTLFRKPTAPQKQEITVKSKHSQKPKMQTPAPTTNEPKYDFYQLLPKMTVDVPKPE